MRHLLYTAAGPPRHTALRGSALSPEVGGTRRLRQRAWARHRGVRKVRDPMRTPESHCGRIGGSPGRRTHQVQRWGQPEGAFSIPKSLQHHLHQEGHSGWGSVGRLGVRLLSHPGGTAEAAPVRPHPACAQLRPLGHCCSTASPEWQGSRGCSLRPHIPPRSQMPTPWGIFAGQLVSADM